MKVFDIATNSESQASISLIEKEDLALIKKSKQYVFNWSKLKDKTIYKLTKKDEHEILGLICLTNHQEGWDAIEIELIEVSKANVGKNKTIKNIGACLIAFACRESFKAGHEGWIFLKPKTNLIKHYEKEYGFIKTGYSMSLDDITAKELIDKYL